MTNASLNTQLYQKMYAELEHYKAYLMTLPPAEILKHASEYICRENILMAMENNDLNNARAKALLKSPTPLADIYNKYASWEHGRQQEEIWNAVEARSGECSVQSFLQHRDPKGRRLNVIHSTRNH